ncbi:hypothetical protein AGMMS49982_04550 [Bacteroidia bacterium]|nr:hypothetical protein AGMMS49982_04550 [Bacteroidia bacterium]
MKRCPQCQKENSSTANHCMYCSDPLVVGEDLSAEAKLQKEINEAKETIRLHRKQIFELEYINNKTLQDTNKYQQKLIWYEK